MRTFKSLAVLVLIVPLLLIGGYAYTSNVTWTSGWPLIGTDPDVDSAGEIGIDTDDHALRGASSGPVQYLYGQKVKTIQYSVQDLANMGQVDGRETTSAVIWYNATPFSFIITSIRGISDADNLDFSLFESYDNTNLSTASDTLIDLIECDANGTSCYYDLETTISHATVETAHYIIWEHTAGTATLAQVCIIGYFDGDVD